MIIMILGKKRTRYRNCRKIRKVTLEDSQADETFDDVRVEP